MKQEYGNHVKIILDEWILETTRPGKHVNFSKHD